VRIVEVTHPLFGRTLEAHGFRRLGGELRLAVTLPDGSSGLIAASATDLCPDEVEGGQTVPTVLSPEGFRRLRALIEAKSRRSKNRGTRRRST
jgi:hypothetical protein